jgi:hypothetical protein
MLEYIIEFQTHYYQNKWSDNKIKLLYEDLLTVWIIQIHWTYTGVRNDDFRKYSPERPKCK